MKDRGQTWIKIKHKDKNEIIYLEFTQGKYTKKDHEKNYNSLIPKINSNIKNKNHIEKLSMKSKSKKSKQQYYKIIPKIITK